MILTDYRERVRFFRFLIVGLTGTVVDFGLFNLIISVFHVNPVLASVGSFCMAVVNNFAWNRYWTYPDSRSKKISRQLSQFAIVNTVGLLIRTPLVALLDPVLLRYFRGTQLSIHASTQELLAHNITLGTSVVIVLFWNFFVNRYWTYSDIDN